MRKIALLVMAFLFLVALLGAQEQKYTNNSFARLSYLSGNAYIQRSSDLGYEEAEVNMPLVEGDRLGTTNGRVEVFLGNRTYLRLDENTKVDFMKLPKKDDDLIRINVWSGNAYLDVNLLQKEKDIEIHTQDASFYVLDRGLYRVDVRENREMEILVFQGMLEASGEDGSVLVKNQQRLAVKDGRFSSKPSQFVATPEDDFDRWSGFRETQVSKTVGKKTGLPSELEDFEAELDEYGEWVYVAPYGNVWVPGDQADDWRPYSYGRWTWLAMSGWTWLPYEPWGWAPYHYGRWHWGMGMGWYWIPSAYWGPGWVNWWWDDYYFGWAPMGWYGYPVAIIDGRFYDRYDGFYPYNSRALTVVHKDQLKAKNMSDVALRGDSLKALNKISLSGSQPSLKPSAGKLSIQEMDGKKVMIRKEGQSLESRPENRLDNNSIRTPGARVTGNTETPVNRNPAGTEERRIRPSGRITGAPAGIGRTPVRKNTFGYPSSPDISIKKIRGSSGSMSSGSIRDRLYRYIQGGSSSSSRVSSRGISSRGGSSPSSGGRGSGSISSRGSSGSSGRTGSVRKK